MLTHSLLGYDCDQCVELISDSPRDPSGQPTPSISGQPSSQPSDVPSISAQPSSQPSIQPSLTIVPSEQPSSEPSSEPSSQPSSQPSQQPTNPPIIPCPICPTRRDLCGGDTNTTTKDSDLKSSIASLIEEVEDLSVSELKVKLNNLLD